MGRRIPAKHKIIFQHPARARNPTQSGFKLKPAIKFLASFKDNEIQRQVLKNGPNSLIKSICNAALNAEQGDIRLSQRQKQILRNNRHLIQNLTSRQLTIPRKRKIIGQQGGALGAIIPIILSTVLSALGTKLFER